MDFCSVGNVNSDPKKRHWNALELREHFFLLTCSRFFVLVRCNGKTRNETICECRVYVKRIRLSMRAIQK